MLRVRSDVAFFGTFSDERMKSSEHWDTIGVMHERNSVNLEEELRTLVRLFNDAKVSYALCGGMAVAIHGFPRFTNDIDFLVDA